MKYIKHPFHNFEIQKYYQNEPKFNEVYSRDNLLDKMKDVAFVINLDEYSNIRTHWTALYTLHNNVTYFDSFGIQHILKEIRNIIGRSSITINIYGIQAY